jgi:hypothetical protein
MGIAYSTQYHHSNQQGEYNTWVDVPRMDRKVDPYTFLLVPHPVDLARLYLV